MGLLASAQASYCDWIADWMMPLAGSRGIEQGLPAFLDSTWPRDLCPSCGKMESILGREVVAAGGMLVPLAVAWACGMTKAIQRQAGRG
jgi:hypothetical protein